MAAEHSGNIKLGKEYMCICIQYGERARERERDKRCLREPIVAVYYCALLECVM